MSLNEVRGFSELMEGRGKGAEVGEGVGWFGTDRGGDCDVASLLSSDEGRTMVGVAKQSLRVRRSNRGVRERC